MLIGVPKEIKNHEYRIGLTPAGVKELVSRGHEVIIENNGGLSIGLTNQDYLAAGARIEKQAAAIFAAADLIIKVKEPQPSECKLLRPGQLLFTYLHLAPAPEQTRALLNSHASCIAYETVSDDMGGLPLLAPMSEVAGRMAVQQAAHHLEITHGGRGVLLGGVPGVKPAHITILGGGVVGVNAARMATGLGADVTIIDKSIPRLKQIDELFNGRIKTLFSTTDTIEQELAVAEAVIGAVLIPGATAPKLVMRKHLSLMKKGAVLVDVAIDQGGCFETSKPTTHQHPTYVIDDIIHYCVANMPGGVAQTSTYSLTNATLPFIINLADNGHEAFAIDKHLADGLSIHYGMITSQAVASAMQQDYTNPFDALNTHPLQHSA